MAQSTDRDDRLPVPLAADRYLGVAFPDGRFAIQEVDNPNGWIVSTVSVVPLR